MVRIVSVAAWGGVGKSSLINAWMDRLKNAGHRGARRVFGWSFEQQGIASPTASADAFIDEALDWFGHGKEKDHSPWARGRRLAELVKEQETLLLLDGLEPLQHPSPGPDAGGVRDTALAAFLQNFVRSGTNGLCVITTREPLGADITAVALDAVLELDLGHLSAKAGALLLENAGVKGEREELEQASRELDGHALALQLLGSYLVDAYGGDVMERAKIPDRAFGDHVGRMMAAYDERLAPDERQLLLVLGLFDRQVDRSTIEALADPPAIPSVTDKIVKPRSPCLESLDCQPPPVETRRRCERDRAGPDRHASSDPRPFLRGIAE